MTEHRDETPRPRYDRALLLHGAKRNEVLTLAEVEQYGLDAFGRAEYLSIYGMPPREWYHRGIRLLGRTAVECTRDALADPIGRDIAAVARLSPTGSFLAVDPFAGSCNTLYWILRHVPASEGLAFELDPQVFDLTRRNVATLDRRIELIHGDYASLIERRPIPADRALILFVAPPLGQGAGRGPGTGPSKHDAADRGGHRVPRAPVLDAPAAGRDAGVREGRPGFPRRGSSAPRMVRAARLPARRRGPEPRHLARNEGLDALGRPGHPPLTRAIAERHRPGRPRRLTHGTGGAPFRCTGRCSSGAPACSGGRRCTSGELKRRPCTPSPNEAWPASVLRRPRGPPGEPSLYYLCAGRLRASAPCLRQSAKFHSRIALAWSK